MPPLANARHVLANASMKRLQISDMSYTLPLLTSQLFANAHNSQLHTFHGSFTNRFILECFPDSQHPLELEENPGLRRHGSSSIFKFLGSRLLKFTVGAEVDSAASEFYLHEDAVAWLSKRLETMIKGGEGGLFSAAQAGGVVWPHVKREIFECFAEFAYTCDYSIPKPAIQDVFQKISVDPTSSEAVPRNVFGDIPTVSEPLRDPSWLFGSSSCQKTKRPNIFMREREVDKTARLQAYSGLRLAENFNTLSYPLLIPRSRSTSCDPSLPFSKASSYLDILLCHATLYILADLWVIDSLKALALHKLHATLCAFELDDNNTEDIVALARYAYKKGKRSDEGIGGLRSLVCQYMAANAGALSLDDGFMDLLEEGGPLVRDLWTFEVQRP